jgi:hypothetical protein
MMPDWIIYGIFIVGGIFGSLLGSIVTLIISKLDERKGK